MSRDTTRTGQDLGTRTGSRGEGNSLGGTSYYRMSIYMNQRPWENKGNYNKRKSSHEGMDKWPSGQVRERLDHVIFVIRIEMCQGWTRGLGTLRSSKE